MLLVQAAGIFNPNTCSQGTWKPFQYTGIRIQRIPCKRLHTYTYTLYTMPCTPTLRPPPPEGGRGASPLHMPLQYISSLPMWRHSSSSMVENIFTSHKNKNKINIIHLPRCIITYEGLQAVVADSKFDVTLADSNLRHDSSVLRSKNSRNFHISVEFALVPCWKVKSQKCGIWWNLLLLLVALH